ncbi:DNA/RNA polymerase [Xylariomycetidae sp. FL2044]|nr:DNA/RNA polymerase [Xylariomycetidae sp. FL2044]
MYVRPPTAQRSLALRRLRLQTPNLTSVTSPSRSLVTRPSLSPWRRKNASSPYEPIPRRHLATPVSEAVRHDDIPFDSISSQVPGKFTPRPLYELRGFDPSTPLQLKYKSDPFPRSKLTRHAVPGGVDEMLSVFDACLQVGKLDRASLVLERFNDMGVWPPDELADFHNRYLRVAINKAVEESDTAWTQSLHSWFEMSIRSRDVPQTAETIACMLKISLLSAQGSDLEQLVHRYMDLMPGEALINILSQVHILNEQDLSTIASIYQPASDLVDEWELESGIAEEEIDYAEPVTATASPPEASPGILPTEQKGLGLKTLRSVLSFFDEIKGQDVSQLPPAQRREVQARLERDAVEAAINRWREENQALMKMGRNTSFSTSAFNSSLYEWHCALEAKLTNEFALISESEKRERKSRADQDRCLYAPFLRQSTPARLAAVTIMSILNTLASAKGDKGMPLSATLATLAKGVEDDIKYQNKQQQSLLRKKQRRAMKLLEKSGLPKQVDAEESSSTPVSAKNDDVPSHIIEVPAYETTSWPILIKSKVGAALLSGLIEVARVTVVRENPHTKELVSQEQPALAHTNVVRKGKKIGLIRPNRALVEIMKREPRADFLARHLPMLVEPQPWTKFDKGGFLEYPSNLVRVKHGEKDQRIYAEAAVNRGDMQQACKGLDVLGRTAWRINRQMYDVMAEVWNSGQPLANIPPLDPQIPLPPEPEDSGDIMERRAWLQRVKAIENEKSGLHSERCFMNFQLEIARALKDQTFYFPHNMDFRGRAYPLPVYLNHMGADHVRGLLTFAEGRELGESGLRWLKVHLANVFGFDKASLGEREAFAEEHIDDISDSVSQPLHGRQWWLKAEDPWQCLAACFELKAALDLPDPTKYISHLPIHQDGTCNGLQHYAALGGDLWGAQQVNLEPGDRPADVYTAVAELVKESISKDNREADHPLARAVEGKITRKIVKQTVMTNVYGVTFIGARAQVLRQLDAAYPDLQEQTGVPAMIAASYIATKIFKALSTMFRGAHDIQYWLGECAGRVCRALTPEQIERIEAQTLVEKPSKTKASKGKRASKNASPSTTDDMLSAFRSTIVWTTPLRMPVVQPYRKNGSRVIPTCLQDLTLQIPERSDPVNRRKQLQAFPPNFIHSLDASHMLLSAIECDQLGLSFAAVHDSFWTHAADVDVMNRVLRDSFTRIHSEDVIGRLSSEFHARHKGSLYMASIERGTPAEKAISSFRTKSGHSSRDELLAEWSRMRLLNSSDPEEVRKGQAITTPGSIYQEFAVSPPTSEESDVAVTLGSMVDDGSQAESEMEAGDADDFTTENTPPQLADSPSLDMERIKKLMNVNRFEAHMGGLTKVKQKKTKNYIHVWLPLTFPDVPEKGEWDVSRLKSSQYFFS